MPKPSQRVLATACPPNALTARTAWRQLLAADETYREALGTPREHSATLALHQALDDFNEACFVTSLGGVES